MAIKNIEADKIDVLKVKRLPTLYPADYWIIAYGATRKMFDKIKKKIDKDYSFVKNIVMPHWIEIVNSSGTDTIAPKPIFPSYMFLHLDNLKEWVYIEEVDGISRILKESVEKHIPYILKPKEISYIMDLTINSLELIEPSNYSLLGQRVVIKEGLFKDFCGIVIEDGYNVKIDLELKNKSIILKINRMKVAKIMHIY